MLKVTGINFRQVVIVCGLLSAGFSFGFPAIAANECVLLPSNSPTSFCPYNSDQSNCRAPTSGSIGCYTTPPNPTQLFVTPNSSCKDDPRTNATGTNTCKSTQRLDCNTISCVCTFCGDASATFNGTLNSCTSGNISTQGAPCAGSPSLLTVASGRTFNSNCPSGGIYTNTCGGVGCPAGTFLSGGACVPNPVYMQLNAAQSGWFAVTSNNAPGAPVALGSMYFDTAGGANAYKYWNGTAWIQMAGGGAGTLTGTGAAGQLAFWTAASTLGSSSGMAWDGAKNQLSVGTTPGSATQPTYTFGGNTTVGLFSPAAGALGFSTGTGLERLRIDGAGNAMFGAVVAAPLPFELTGGTSDTLMRLSAADTKWNGLRFDRPSAGAGNEKWYIGMKDTGTDSYNDFFFRRSQPGTSTDVMVLDGTVTGGYAVKITPGNSMEGLRIISSDFSPFVIRDTADFNDVFRIDQSGKVIASALRITGGSPVSGMVLTSDSIGNAVWATPAAGGACGGRKFKGLTTVQYDGLRGGYTEIDKLCGASGAQWPGSKVCTAEEVMNNYKCGEPALSAVGVAGSYAWVSQGAPGYTSFANDCDGWTSKLNDGAHFGRQWLFDAVGGKGSLAACDANLKLACCQ